MFRDEFKLGSEILLASLVLLLSRVALALLGKVTDKDLVNRVDFLKEVNSGLNGVTRVEEADDGDSCSCRKSVEDRSHYFYYIYYKPCIFT